MFSQVGNATLLFRHKPPKQHEREQNKPTKKISGKYLFALLNFRSHEDMKLNEDFSRDSTRFEEEEGGRGRDAGSRA